jgi:hypothetical protein
MATQRQPKYPSGLDKVAEQFGISTIQLLEAIAEGNLIVVPRPSIEDDLDFDTQAGVVAGLHESWKQAMKGDVRPISELWDAVDDE